MCAGRSLIEDAAASENCPPTREMYDPNGIRTRVTAVKGRCPRPLDDRVRRAPNIGAAHSVWQGISSRCDAERLREDQPCAAVAPRWGPGLRARLRPSRSPLGSRRRRAAAIVRLSFIRDRQRAALLDQRLRERGEVFHVRAEDRPAVRHDRLRPDFGHHARSRLLPMKTTVATAYQSRSSPVVSSRRQSSRSRARRRLRCDRSVASRARRSCERDLRRPLDVTRRDDEEEVREILRAARGKRRARISSSPACVLPPSRIGRARIDPEVLQQRARLGVRSRQISPDRYLMLPTCSIRSRLHA